MVSALDGAFANLIDGLKQFVRSVDSDLLYRRSGTASLSASIAEQILRSAAAVEQTFGGLTANLWDDPFEWTLPETLATSESIVDYLAEVDSVRERAFSSIDGDQSLMRLIAVPAGEPKTLIELLLETLVRASEYRGRAVATLKILSG